MSNPITIRPDDREAWLTERRRGIGSSEIGTILGLSPFETPYQLWQRKRGEGEQKEETFAMRAGHYLEDAVSRFFSDETGAVIDEESAGDFIVRDGDKPFLQVSPDRYYTLGGRNGICECKTTQLEVSEESVPKHWYCQLQYQMGVTGIHDGALAWFVKGRSFGCCQYTFDSDLFAFISDKIERFWVDNVLGGKEPEAANVEDVLRKFRDPRGEVVASDADLLALVELRELRAKAKADEERIKTLEDGIKMAMADKDTLVNASGEVLATWKAAKGRVSFDSKRFKEEHPDTYKEYQKEGAPVRTFRLK